MPITIQLTGATAQEVAELVAQLASVLPTMDLNELPALTEVSTFDEYQADTPSAEVKAEPAKETKTKKQEPKEEVKTESKQTETFTLETVRSTLSTLSQSGKQAEVKELIASMGATKLTEIDPTKFAEMMEKARALA